MVPLELSRRLSVSEVTNETGRALPFFQNEEVAPEEMLLRGNDAVFVVLPQAATAGETFRLRIAYRGSVISDAGNGVLFVGERGSWYPHAGGAGNFVPFELSFRWPRRLTLVATGKKLEEREEGEWRSGKWKSEAPIPVAGFNLGEYVSGHVETDTWKIDLYANPQLEKAVLERFDKPVVERPARTRSGADDGGAGLAFGQAPGRTGRPGPHIPCGRVRVARLRLLLLHLRQRRRRSSRGALRLDLEP